MDATQWTLEANNNNHNTSSSQVHEERKVARPNKEVVNCPRCKSTNTKFCYYNNYSSTQPRYFCKACRRYWTQGGSLRNVPVGGGSRKNKRSSSSSQIPKPVDHLSTTTFSSQTQYLNLGGFQQQYRHDLSQFQKPPEIENSSNSTNHLLNFLSSSSNTSTNLTYALPQHMLSTGTGLNSFNSNPGFNIVQEFKPTMGGFTFHESARFQQQDGFNQRETTTDQNMGQGDSTVYWN